MAKVWVDDRGVSVDKQRLEWDDLQEVAAAIDFDRPGVCLGYIVELHGGNGQVLYANTSMEGFDVLVGRIHALPGFEKRAYARLADETASTGTVCWTRR